MPVVVEPGWATEVLEWWIEHADAALMSGRSRREYSFCGSGPRTDALLEREAQTRRVIAVVLKVERVDQLVRPLGRNNFMELQTGLDLARRALGVLRTEGETAAHVTGTRAPAMSADSLHPVVWDAAAKLWNDGHYSSAVQRAATFLNAHVQDRLDRRDVSDSALMAQAFSVQPPEPDKPRLRWPGEDSDLTVKAMRAGLLQFSQGCFMAIRNPASHSTAELATQEALEQLATLSMLARWIDACEVVAV